MIDFYAEFVSIMTFSFDSKFLFTAGGDNPIRKISCVTMRVIWSFDFCTMAPFALIPLDTSPRIIWVSPHEKYIINYRSKLLELEVANDSNWAGLT
jgi:hypothetical protein